MLAVIGAISLQAQTVTVSTGASYSNQAYYNIQTDDVTTLANTAWDLAFSTDPNDAGIFVNEAVKSVLSGPYPELRLYLAPTFEFEDPINPASLTDSLYNPEINWQNGAFNSMKDDLDPSDFGWGFTGSGDTTVIGYRIFALQLRDDTWKKIKIESLVDGVYTMRYADLDGANEQIVTVDKADFAGSPLAYYSFSTGVTVASPTAWDLLFTRYHTPLSGGGAPIQYLVTGVLSGPGTEVAEAQGVDPATVNYEDYLDSLQAAPLDIIGQDWKYFDLQNFVWVLDDERAFFVKLANNQLWKIVFTGFGGSTNGNFIFEKTYLGEVSGVEESQSGLSAFRVFPNPAAEEITVAFSLKEEQNNLSAALITPMGQIVRTFAVSGHAGLNVLAVNVSSLPEGSYFLRLGGEMGRVFVVR